MRALFADASYWVALLDHRDKLHGIAARISEKIGSHRVITSEFVLLEVLQLSTNFRTRMREPALRLIERMRVDPNTEVVLASSELFQEACRLFGERKDKEWDPIDCSSFLIMQERGITEVFTYDRHFEQMGFKALLREESKSPNPQSANVDPLPYTILIYASVNPYSSYTRRSVSSSVAA